VATAALVMLLLTQLPDRGGGNFAACFVDYGLVASNGRISLSETLVIAPMKSISTLLASSFYLPTARR